VGADGTYTVSVTNAGPDAATDVIVRITLPAGVEAGAATGPSGWSCVTAAGTVECRPPAGTLAVGTTVLAVPARFTAAATHVLADVLVVTTTADPNSTNNNASASTAVAAPQVTTVTQPQTTTPTTQPAQTVQATTTTTAGSSVQAGTQTQGAATPTGSLPRTGSEPMALVWTATALVLAGLLLEVASRARSLAGIHRPPSRPYDIIPGRRP
jgi:uncharacterized repeat protein (TIGR01451 family)